MYNVPPFCEYSITNRSNMSIVLSQKGVNFFCYSPKREFVLQYNYGIFNKIKRNERSETNFSSRTCENNWCRNFNGRNVGKHQPGSWSKNTATFNILLRVFNRLPFGANRRSKCYRRERLQSKNERTAIDRKLSETPLSNTGLRLRHRPESRIKLIKKKEIKT